MTDANSTPTTDQPQKPQPGAVPYSRFKAVNDELRALERAQAERGTTWETEAADWQRKIAETQAEVRRLELRILKEDVAAAAGLPRHLAHMLRGDDRDALLADAEQLISQLPGLKVNAAPEFTPAQLADPGFYARNRARIAAALKAGRLR